MGSTTTGACVSGAAEGRRRNPDTFLGGRHAPEQPYPPMFRGPAGAYSKHTAPSLSSVFDSVVPCHAVPCLHPYSQNAFRTTGQRTAGAHRCVHQQQASQAVGRDDHQRWKHTGRRTTDHRSFPIRSTSCDPSTELHARRRSLLCALRSAFALRAPRSLSRGWGGKSMPTRARDSHVDCSTASCKQTQVRGCLLDHIDGGN